MPSVPTFDQFIEPLLRVLADRNEPMRAAEVYEVVADLVGLSEEQRAEVLSSGRQPYYKNRIGWAHDRLKRAGLSESPKRGHWRLTDEGRRTAGSELPLAPERVAQMAFRPETKRLTDDEEGESVSPIVEALDETRTPEERLQAAYQEIRERTQKELLELVWRSSPAFFERLVLDLLHAMGYGAGPDSLNQTGASGDGGIDGVISLDRLGLEKVYVQAKRYAEGNVVGRPAIQGFFGALAGRRATKGVFLTTSSFSSEARQFAASASDSIVLVNGARLASLMIEHGVGVSRRELLTLVEVDSDYFEND